MTQVPPKISQSLLFTIFEQLLTWPDLNSGVDSSTIVSFSTWCKRTTSIPHYWTVAILEAFFRWWVCVRERGGERVVGAERYKTKVKFESTELNIESCTVKRLSCSRTHSSPSHWRVPFKNACKKTQKDLGCEWRPNPILSSSVGFSDLVHLKRCKMACMGQSHMTTSHIYILFPCKWQLG